MSANGTETDVMTVRELSDYLRVHPSTCYRLLKRREIPSFRVGSDHRFLRSSIDQWMRQRQAEEAAKVKG